MQNKGREYGHKIVKCLAKVIAFTIVKNVVRHIHIYGNIK